MGCSCPRPQEYCLESPLIKQLVNGGRPANKEIRVNLDAKCLDSLGFQVQNLAGQAEFRDSVAKDPSDRMESFKNCHLVPHFGQFRRTRQPGRT